MKKDTITQRVARICAVNPGIKPMDVIKIYVGLYNELPKHSTIARKVAKYRKEAKLREQSAQSLRSYGNEGVSHGEWAFIIAAIVCFAAVVTIVL